MIRTVLAAVNSKYIHTSLGMRCLAAYARQEGLTVSLVEESINTPILTVLQKLAWQQPEFIGLEAHIWNRDYVFQLVRMLRQVLPQVILCLGGPEVMFDPEKTVRELPQLDYLLCGEGEELLAQLLHQLQAPQVSPRAGEACRILGRGDDGRLSVVADLGVLPFPYPDLTEMVRQHRICYYECTRGCPFHCTYCLSGISHQVRRRPLKIVLADLQRFLDAKVPLVKFVDRTYNLDEDYYLPILKFLAQAQTQTVFHLEVKADLLSQRALKFFTQAPTGRFQLEIGVQSTNQKTLAVCGRDNDWDRLSANVQLLQQAHKQHLHLDLIAGLPSEDLASFSRSFNQVYALRPQMLQLGFLKLLPGTVLAKKAAQYGLVSMAAPPYQVLSTRAITYQELSFLEVLTSVFDLTYNSGFFGRSLDLLQQWEQGDAFKLYQNLADWWLQQGLYGSGHGAGKTTELLYRYVCARFPQRRAEFREILRYDVWVHQPGLHPEWLGWHTQDLYELGSRFWRQEEEVRHYLPDFHFTNWRSVKKNYGLEYFAVDPRDLQVRTVTALIDYQQGKIFYPELPSFIQEK